MKPEPQREEALFQAAAQLTGPARAAFLAQACADDAGLRQRLEALLAAHEASAGVLGEEPAAAILAPTLDLPEGPPDEAVGTTLGRYKLREKLGVGGCGVVYVAEQTEPVQRRVALKVIKLGMDTREVIARFEAERQALAMMDHPNIAKVFDAGTTDSGRPYFVMELVRGIRITDYCDQANLSTKERLDLFIKVCQAIQHAHQKGIIHRDIKPSNILVTLHDGVPVPKVIDFGIAKATEGRLTDATVYTQLHQFIGTPAYMSPEQAEMSGLDIDTRSDIYSLGVLLYQLLTSKTPFDGKELLALGIDEMRRTIREKEPMRPSTRLATLQGDELTTTAKRRSADAPKLIHLLKGDLDWIVMKCLEKDRTRRYDTANGLAQDIVRHLSNEPVVARPPSTVYRLQKLVRRNRAAFAAAGVVAAALILGVFISTWQAIRATRAEREKAGLLVTANEAKASEEKHRHVAEDNAAQAQAAVTRLEIDRAEMLFASDQSAEALAYLARVLRREPTNRVAGERIISALAHRNFCVPLFRLEHQGTVTAAEFSPDGQRVLTASKDGKAQIWDGRTGQPVIGPFQHTGAVTAARFSLDGAKVLTASLDQTARIWDARTGRPLTESLPHAGGVLCADFSPDGQRVATGSADGSMRLWNVDTGALLGTPVTGDAGVGFVKFSPDGRWIVLQSQDAHRIQRIRLLNAFDGTELAALPGGVDNAPEYPKPFPSFSPDGTRVVATPISISLTVVSPTSPTANRASQRLHQNTMTSARFSPDGQTLATSAVDSTAKLWDADTFQPVADIPHEDWVNSIEFSRDGGQVVTGSRNRTARIWDARSGRPLSEPLRHDASVLSARFSPDGQRILSRCDGTAVWVWEVRIGQPSAVSLQHSERVRKAVFSPDGERAATTEWLTDSTGIVRLWDARRGTPLLPPLGSGLWDLQFSGDGRQLLSLDYLTASSVWDTRDGSVIGGAPGDTNFWHTGPKSARFSPDGQLAVASELGPRVKVWKISTGNVVKEFLHDAKAGFAQFSPDGQWVITTSEDNTARLWDVETGRPKTEPLRHDDVVFWADVSADSQRVVTISRDKTARLWAARSGKLLHTLPHASDPYAWNSVQFSPDGRWVATAAGNSAQIWNSDTGQPVAAALKHDGRVNSVRFSPDGKRLLTSCLDRLARIWDTASGHLLSEPIRHRDRVDYAEFSPDGSRVITASVDGTARIWELPNLASPISRSLIDWAEAVGGQRMDAQNTSQTVPFTEMLRLRQSLAHVSGGDETTRWAKWFFEEMTTRKISPSSTVSLPEYVEQRIEDSTLESLQQAVRLSPTNGLAQGRLALLRLASETEPSPRQIAGADWQSRHAVALSPENPEVLCARAEVCERLGRVSEAWELMERGSRLKPVHPRFWHVRGRMLEQTNRLEEAYQAYSQALGLAGSNWVFLKIRNDVLLRRSDLLRRLNRPTESKADYEKFVETLFTGQDANNHAWALIIGPPETRDPERAVFLAQRAVRLNPQEWNWVNTLGVAYYRAGQYGKAVETLLESGKLNPDGPTVCDLFFLAMSRQQLGETGPARAHFEKALQWWRDHPAEGSNKELKSFQAEAEALLSQEKRP